MTKTQGSSYIISAAFIFFVNTSFIDAKIIGETFLYWTLIPILFQKNKSLLIPQSVEILLAPSPKLMVLETRSCFRDQVVGL